MILGIDYGTKKIGFALGDEETKIAVPWKIVENASREKILTLLNEIISEYHITRIVVGIPLSSSLQDTSQTTLTRKFVAHLQKSFTIPVETEDEFLSSKEARAKLHEAGIKKHAIDAHSATIILQDWMDKHQKSYSQRNY